MKNFFASLFLILFISNFSFAADAPNLVITTLDGKNFNLKEKKGKVVIVVLWAQWCIDCREEMPILNKLSQKYKDIEIIGVSIDKNSQRQRVIDLTKNLSYQNAMIGDATENNFEEPDSIPTNYIINKKGEVVKKIAEGVDELSEENFDKIIKSLL